MIVDDKKEVAKFVPVHKMVKDYEDGLGLLVEGYAAIDAAYDKFKTLLNGAGVGPKVLPDRGYYSRPKEEIDGIVKTLKKDAWHNIVTKTNVKSFTTHKRNEAMMKDLEDPDKLPAVTVDNIKKFVDNLHGSAPELILEFIKETFEWLKPGCWNDGLKTNAKNKYELHDKAIKHSMIESNYSGGYRVRYGYYGHGGDVSLHAMHNAFSLADGKGVSTYPGDSVTLINDVGRDGSVTKAENEYFEFKWFKNGNLHIKFKRMDLVAKINQIAGGGMLKPEMKEAA